MWTTIEDLDLNPFSYKSCQVCGFVQAQQKTTTKQLNISTIPIVKDRQYKHVDAISILVEKQQ